MRHSIGGKASSCSGRISAWPDRRLFSLASKRGSKRRSGSGIPEPADRAVAVESRIRSDRASQDRRHGSRTARKSDRSPVGCRPTESGSGGMQAGNGPESEARSRHRSERGLTDLKTGPEKGLKRGGKKSSKMPLFFWRRAVSGCLIACGRPAPPKSTRARTHIYFCRFL